MSQIKDKTPKTGGAERMRVANRVKRKRSPSMALLEILKKKTKQNDVLQP